MLLFRCIYKYVFPFILLYYLIRIDIFVCFLHFLNSVGNKLTSNNPSFYTETVSYAMCLLNPTHIQLSIGEGSLMNKSIKKEDISLGDKEALKTHICHTGKYLQLKEKDGISSNEWSIWRDYQHGLIKSMLNVLFYNWVYNNNI